MHMMRRENPQDQGNLPKDETLRGQEDPQSEEKTQAGGRRPQPFSVIVHQSNRHRSARQTRLLQGAILLVMFAAFGLSHPDLMRAIMDGNADGIIAALEEASKIRAAIFIAVIQVLQFVTIVFPGMPIHIAAGILLGPVTGFLACYLSFLLGNALVYSWLRRSGAGKRNVTLPAKIKMNRKAAKIIDRLTQEEGGTIRIVMVSILPFFPNGIVPYYAASMKISGKAFLAGVAVGSPVPIITDCLAGHLLLHGHIFLAVLISAALFAVAFFLGLHEEEILRFIHRKEG